VVMVALVEGMEEMAVMEDKSGKKAFF
jgi:hypothetical protein